MPGVPNKMRVVDHKTWPNKIKLTQLVGTRLVDTSSKKGNIWSTGGSIKHVMVDRLGVYQLLVRGQAGKKIVKKRVDMPPCIPTPKTPSPPLSSHTPC